MNLTKEIATPIDTSVSMLEVLRENYKTFGGYINGTRGNVGLDGLKAVQRRVLLSVRDKDTGGNIGSTEVLAHCLSNYHPHGLDSTYDTLIRLVQKGFVLPASNFGNIDTFDPSDAAAYRYTEVKVHKPFSEGVFKFVDLVEKYENEYGKIEPKNLPVPIPLALTTGSTGIGFGCNSSIPFFSARSLFNAMQADNPDLLKAPNGLYIVNGTLKQLWEQGDGFIQYGYKCFSQYSELDGKTVSIIEGPGRYFPTSVNDYFGDLEAEGSVFIRDESTNKTRVAISRVKNLKRITDEEVHKLALEASVSQLFFRVYITEDEITKKISIRRWMNKLWDEYKKVVDVYKSNRQTAITHKIKIYESIPLVTPLLDKQLSSDDIAKKLKLDISSVKEIESKPIRMLRKSEFSKEIQDLRNEIATVSKLEPKTLAQDIINVLEKAQTV